MCGCFCATTADLSSCNRDPMVIKLRIFTIWPTPVLDSEDKSVTKTDPIPDCVTYSLVNR